MNITKHGIYVVPNHKVRNGNTFKPIPNHIQIYATLTRLEDHHIVWLVVPFYRREIKQLKEDGWKIDEVWRKNQTAPKRRKSYG